MKGKWKYLPIIVIKNCVLCDFSAYRIFNILGLLKGEIELY